MPKWLKALAAAVGGLALLWVLTLIPWGGGKRGPAAPADPVKIALDGPRGKVTLEKKDGRWRTTVPVEGAADEEAVLQLLSGLKDFAAESEVTRRPEDLSRYELSDVQAFRVTVWGLGAGPFDVFVGKNAGFTGRAYVRVGKDPAVWMAAGLSRDQLDLPPVRWRDRQVIDRPDIVRARVTRGKASFEVAKSSDAWTLDGKPADADRASSFFSALRTLAADDLKDAPTAADVKADGLDAPAARFELSFSTGAPLAFSIGKGDPLPLRRDGAETVYLIPSYRAAMISKEAKDFLPAAAAPPKK